MGIPELSAALRADMLASGTGFLDNTSLTAYCDALATAIWGNSPAGGPHASTHQPGGSDALAVDAAAATGSLRTIGTGALQAAAGNHTHAIVSPDRITPVDSSTSIQWALAETAAPWANTGNGGALNLTKDAATSDPIPMTGLFGGALYFGASPILQTVPTSTGEPTSKLFTWSAWVTPHQLGDYWIVIKSHFLASWTDPYMMFGVTIDAQGTWKVYLQTDDHPAYSLQYSLVDCYRLRLFEKVFLAVTYDGSYLRGYHNGCLSLQVAWTGNVRTGEHGPWQVGGIHIGSTGPTTQWKGIIEDVRVENACRSQAYLEAQYRAGASLWV